MPTCKLCRSDIRPAAKICPICNRSQNWYIRNINLSIPALSLLVALVSVLATGGDEIRDLIFGKQPNLIAAIEDHSVEHIELTIWNEGSGSALISSAGCSVSGASQTGKKLHFFYTASGSKIVSPGQSGSFAFDFRWAYLGERRLSENSHNSRILFGFISSAHAFGSGGGGPKIECQLWYDLGERENRKRTWIYFNGYDLLSYASYFYEKFRH